MNVFTIGFSQKSAEQFFKLLTENKVKKLIDIRLNNKSQLAGFANAKHLPYFLKLHNIEYEYKLELAPSKELLNGYKDKTISWEGYIKVYNKLLIDRNVLNDISIDDLDSIVLLCSEPTAEQCHRRLLSEYLAKYFNNITIKHL
ncbi:hypothetical protein MS2017_1268 [Bathymodiolus thermophilus thioautotrophic gill symbiont]|uniref:DUF488 domain-containing protein n=1 Tax=Bathymodiolus thermophilus thioautotrophic gill symbiont TaxID=2360 RepID=A0A3G3IME7_9GAMM|nr:DUF488 domain-containing protein [Bathymodiolus thermophilus thioautotrophic gill symbiont]AYQ56965.1 hypothetical protein MS2017_1268 [Bathymodiolus thermophilus thioautotrophic gill symbiont]